MDDLSDFMHWLCSYIWMITVCFKNHIPDFVVLCIVVILSVLTGFMRFISIVIRSFYWHWGNHMLILKYFGKSTDPRLQQDSTKCKLCVYFLYCMYSAYISLTNRLIFPGGVLSHLCHLSYSIMYQQVPCQDKPWQIRLTAGKGR